MAVRVVSPEEVHESWLLLLFPGSLPTSGIQVLDAPTMRFCDAVVCCDAVVELGREVDAALWLIVALYSHVQSTALSE